MKTSESQELQDSKQQILLYAKRYAWIRARPAWESEAYLSELSPEEYDAAVDKNMQTDP